MVRHLTLLPTEPTAPIATSYDLLCWSRLGSAYDPDELTQAVDDQVLVHYLGFLPAGRGPAAAPGRGAVLARPRRRSSRGCTRSPTGSRPTRSAARTSSSHAARRGAAAGHRAPGHLPAHVGLDGLDQQQERPADAVVHAPARRGRGRLEHRAARSCGTWPSGCTATRRCPTPTRRWRSSTPSAPGPGHRPPHRAPRPRRADVRAGRRRAGRDRGRARQVAGRAVAAGRTSTTSRAARRCCRRSTGW